jgi:transcriptional regulator of acetoin/glycerol metabolism
MIGLLEHPFRTNVRELEAMLVAALATPEVAGPWVKAEGDVRRPELSAPDGGHVDAVSAEAIRQCLDANNGSIEHTWRALGLSSRFTLLRLIKKHGLEVRRRPARGRGPVGGVKGGGLLRGPTS